MLEEAHMKEVVVVVKEVKISMKLLLFCRILEPQTGDLVKDLERLHDPQLRSWYFSSDFFYYYHIIIDKYAELNFGIQTPTKT